jgi:hypothetical protein
MQNSGDAALAAAVDANDRYLVYKVEVDWNSDGLYSHALSNLTSVVTGLETTRDINSSLPPETTLLEGFFSGEANIQLGGTRPGDTMTTSQALAMWRTDSVLYGKAKTGYPIRAFIGHRLADGSVVQPQQFQGIITNCEVDSRTNTAVLTATDLSAKVQASINLPNYALTPASTGPLQQGQSVRVNSQWVIDYVLRQNGYYMSPPCHSRVFYAATLHGSVVPERGHQSYSWTGAGNLRDEDPVYVSGRPGWGLAYGGSSYWWSAAYALCDFTGYTGSVSQTLCIQCQVDMTNAANVNILSGARGALVAHSTGNGYLDGVGVVLQVTTTRRVELNIYRNGSLVASVLGPTMATGWQNVWVELELGNPYSASNIRWSDGTSTAVNLSGMTTTPPNPPLLYGNVVTFGQLPMHDLQISDRTGLATQATLYDPTTWVPKADIDTGLNELTGLPLRRGTNSWDLLKEVVGAEYGVLGFTEAGMPYFRNRDSIRRSTLTVVKTVDETKALAEFKMSERIDSVRNSASYTYAARLMNGPLTDPAAWEVVWELDDPAAYLLAPGATTLDLILDKPGLVFTSIFPTQFTTAQWNDPANSTNTNHGFVTTTPNGTAVTSGITCNALTPLSPRDTGTPDRIRLVLVNTTTSYVQFKTTDSRAAFRIKGLAFYNGDATTERLSRAGSIGTYGERLLPLNASDWRQMPRSMFLVANSLLNDLQAPVPVIDQVPMVGDCRLQLQDTISVQDRTALGGPVYCGVVGINRSLQVSGTAGAKLVDNITIRPVAAPTKWVLGSSTLSVLGSTTRL